MVPDHDLVITTPPAEDAVRLSVAKSHLQVAHDDDDDYITQLIKAAQDEVEQSCQRAFVTRSYEMRIDRFPRGIGTFWIYPNPVVSVDQISYLDASGDSQTLDPADYVANTRDEPAQLYPALGKTWPDVYPQKRSVTIAFTAGYGPGPDDVALKSPNGLQAMLYLIGWMFQAGEPVVIGTTGSELPLTYQNKLGALKYGMLP